MRIIPAIDIIEGKCVRLTQGNYGQKTIYNEDPLEVAKEFEGAGISFLHLVDLDGAKTKHIVNWKVLEKIASKTQLHIDFGGGIKSDDDLHIAFESGAQQITGGSIAANNRSTFISWLAYHGPEKIILGADAHQGKVAINGWQENTRLEIGDFISNYQEEGIQYVICTDISKDGMLEGPSFDLYSKILKQNPELKLIASGGISKLQDLEQLQEMGLDGAIIGKAIYEGHIKLGELKSFVL
ncbi:1-(5-phosphoribosyl)-5-[(5-phosphoribosylamino)methylideneamino]imidazole-4-carboxamide isomerase [Xanthovirga aplysinae]|uniref:1-(5-phosphoribosyl)-5-[(5- phosphoribosylamino)methylideneamino]imidazole-4- carboxamide isomerase n=1 Tax=Xanthovirga aplysinae TaxID=2529853 RepID=UPI0012BC19CA|nr:1-(5-phosphoribosyl)-5-[(5-phosphoribosylamino)methylideneamino]imidazole-4-carboxamide isomerase [Xanthovirga aplysinae]MTI32221.1 1-(5-phosphoribosyl)-5-[(5-phosphoribosylamino)methylideneamino]imidazole-4-carboxamide isomerase [Xanthovirga aplysinae]